jgi:hypothetical protein
MIAGRRPEHISGNTISIMYSDELADKIYYISLILRVSKYQSSHRQNHSFDRLHEESKKVKDIPKYKRI